MRQLGSETRYDRPPDGILVRPENGDRRSPCLLACAGCAQRRRSAPSTSDSGLVRVVIVATTFGRSRQTLRFRAAILNSREWCKSFQRFPSKVDAPAKSCGLYVPSPEPRKIVLRTRGFLTAILVPFNIWLGAKDAGPLFPTSVASHERANVHPNAIVQVRLPADRLLCEGFQRTKMS